MGTSKSSPWPAQNPHNGRISLTFSNIKYHTKVIKLTHYFEHTRGVGERTLFLNNRPKESFHNRDRLLLKNKLLGEESSILKIDLKGV